MARASTALRLVRAASCEQLQSLQCTNRYIEEEVANDALYDAERFPLHSRERTLPSCERASIHD